MKLKSLHAIAVLAFVLGTVGCKSQTAREVIGKIQNKANEKKNELAIAGTWVSNCESESIIPKFKTGREVYKFSLDGSFVRTHYFFSDNKCQSPSVARIEKGDLEFPETTDIKSGGGTPVNFKFKKVELETKSKAVVDVLNAIGYCDMHFAVGQKTDLSDASQLGPSCAGIKHVPRKAFDTMKLNGSQLLIGNDATEESIDERPSIGDEAKVFVKGEYQQPNG